MGVALKVLGFAWDNRRAIGRAYHHFVKHKVVLDELLDMAEDSPRHPKNVEKIEKSTRSMDPHDAY